VKPAKRAQTEMPVQPTLVRIQNHLEVALGNSEADAMAEAGRCIQCKKPSCRQGCPAGIDSKGFFWRGEVCCQTHGRGVRLSSEATPAAACRGGETREAAMPFDLRHDCIGVNWALVAETLQRVGMAHAEPEMHRRAFEASHTTVFVYDEAGKMVGFGRALCDGAYQAAVYDVAVLPEFQGLGLGRMILENILERVAGCTVLLYASPGKENFYRKLGFRLMKTGMAVFRQPEAMQAKGFTE
jgi:ribosomal protein S18 acetylase RimI-like enzyme